LLLTALRTALAIHLLPWRHRDRWGDWCL